MLNHYIMKIIQDKYGARIKYDSLNDFFKHTSKDAPIVSEYAHNKNEINDIRRQDRYDWRFGDEKDRKTFYDVRFNSAKGKKICEKSVKETLNTKEYKSLVKQALTYKKSIKFKDSGFRINIPKAIAGEDTYFIHYNNSKKPTVKIAINICGSASVDQAAFRRIAQTAIPTIYALETAGIATEVWYCAFATGTFENGPNNVSTEVLIKSAQQRFNWTTFAPVFTLGTYRENIFMSWLNQDQFETSYGLGKPMDDWQLEENDYYGYTSVIGLNAPGPMIEVNSIFSKIKSKITSKI